MTNFQQIFAHQFKEMDNLYRRNFINSLTGFKSLCLVGTINAEGITNVAPFSQVFHIGANPALIGVLVRPDSTTPRHTLPNIETIGYYTLNHVRADFYKEAHQTSARYQVSEFEACGLAAQFTETHPAPYVEASWIKIGLKFEEKTELKINGTILVIGSIVEVILPANCISQDGYVDLEQAGSVTSSGLDSYHLTRRLGRLAYAKPDKPTKDLEI